MAATETLLSRIAWQYATGYEDVATNALAFIISRSEVACSAFAGFLGDGTDPPPPIAKVQTQYSLPNYATPDMVCQDRVDNVLAFVESKFWAGLTVNQPVTYWNELPADSHATLLFIAPAERIASGTLWSELENRLKQAGHQLASPVCKMEHTKSATAESGGNRRLMVTSWETLLDYLSRSALEHQDTQAAFEIAELQGLANSVIAGFEPHRYDSLKALITSAVNKMVQAGWANTKDLRAGQGNNYWGKYLCLAGAYANFAIHYPEHRRSNRPLWLTFRENYGGKDPGQVTTEQVRDRLASLAPREPVELEDFSRAFCIPIDLLPGGDDKSTRDDFVAQLTDIAHLIDPHIPTYHRDTPNA